MATIRERLEALIAYDDDAGFKIIDPAKALVLADELDREDAAVSEFSLACLSPEARLAVMAPWCRGCGGAKPCSCE